MTHTLQSQRGIGFFGLIFLLVILGFVGAVGIKTLGVLMEFQAVKNALHSMAEQKDLTNQSADEISREFTHHIKIDDVTSITAQDLVINHGEVSVKYDKEVPMFANVSLLFHFAASTQD